MSYPPGAKYDPAAPWNDDGGWKYCTRCGDWLSDGERADPIMIDDEAVCDHCADKLKALEL